MKSVQYTPVLSSSLLRLERKSLGWAQAYIGPPTAKMRMLVEDQSKTATIVTGTKHLIFITFINFIYFVDHVNIKSSHERL